MGKSIQIVCFDNPYPPNYGGAVDVFYKIKCLYDNDINVYLHFFYLDKSQRSEDLYIEKFCKKVFLYKRQITFFTHLSLKPFVVKSRVSDKLIKNLINIGFPVLYEGLNTTSSIRTVTKHNIKTFVRLHNVEHHYYKNLGDLEKSWAKKVYYKLEAFRLKMYQSILRHADTLYAISLKDQSYFSNQFNKVQYLPVFQSKHQLLNVKDQNFCLFHGDLRLSDNIRAAEYLIDFFSKKTERKLVIASSFENENLNSLFAKVDNVVFKKINSLQDLENIFKQTALHILISYQSSGIKLKLLNALYTESYVLTNRKVVEGTGLESCCEVFKSDDELLQKINVLFGEKISGYKRDHRIQMLKPFRVNHAIKILIDNL